MRFTWYAARTIRCPRCHYERLHIRHDKIQRCIDNVLVVKYESWTRCIERSCQFSFKSILYTESCPSPRLILYYCRDEQDFADLLARGTLAERAGRIWISANPYTQATISPWCLLKYRKHLRCYNKAIIDMLYDVGGIPDDVTKSIILKMILGPVPTLAGSSNFLIALISILVIWEESYGSW